MSCIEVRNITVGYGEHTVIRNLSLSVERGEFVGILGQNGCGKTTLLRSMTKILKPDTGTVFVDGKEIDSYDAKEFAKRVGCVSQVTDTAFAFQVKDIVMMGRHPYAGRLKPLTEEDLKIVDEAMRFTQVLDLKDRLITELSGGERQRVLISKTIAQQPKILLLDEPTNHLDVCHQIEILQMLKSLTPEITVVCVLHDLNLASTFCDRLVLMDKGCIKAAGTPSEVLTPKMVYDTFSVRMIISPHPLTGKPYLVPEYGVFSNPGSKRIHVISGGGSGTELFYAFALRGFAVSAGVLSLNDSDAAAAQTLGIRGVFEPPFAAVSSGSAAKMRELIDDSDAVVLAGMPVGPGNLENLSVLLDVKKPVYILGSVTDFAGGRAKSLCDELVRRGAMTAESLPELVKMMQ